MNRAGRLFHVGGVVILLTVLCTGPAHAQAESLLSLVLPNCGSVSIKETEPPQSSQIGYNIELSHDFTPSLHCNSCLCKQIVFIQALRITLSSEDPGAETFLFPKPHMRDRMVKNHPDDDLNGWAIDRARRDAQYGYYGMKDNGQLSNVEPGNNTINPTKSAQMWDSPDIAGLLAAHGGPLKFEAITVPICIDTDNTQGFCGSCLLNFELWSYDASMDGRNGKMSTLSHQVLGAWLIEAIDLAIGEWNSQPGHQPFPSLKKL
jgi:hypothetical protein